MHCVVLTIAEPRRMNCSTDTDVYGPFESPEDTQKQVAYLRGAFRERVLYLRAFDLSPHRRAAIDVC